MERGAADRLTRKTDQQAKPDDASAIVKLFVTETGSENVVTEQEPFVISALTRVEVTSAIWMKARVGTLTTQQSSLLAAHWRAQLNEGQLANGTPIFEVAITADVLHSAARLCGTHGLRAGDAVQLATAFAVRAVEPSCTRYWVFDQRLADAAAKEGFTVIERVE